MAKGDVARNKDGTFPAGVSGNPHGRPPSKRNVITELKQDLEIAIRQGVKRKDIQDIVDAMVEEAKNGGVQAAKLILDKTISNARESEEIKHEGGGVRVIIENVTVGRENETIEADEADYEEIEEN